MYWADDTAQKIRIANLDGTNVADLPVTGLDHPRGIALDLRNAKVYWTDYGTDKIQRADLEGTNVEDLVTVGLDSPYGIAIIPEPATLGLLLVGGLALLRRRRI